MKPEDVLSKVTVNGRVYGRTPYNRGRATIARTEDDGSVMLFGMLSKLPSGSFHIIVDCIATEKKKTPLSDVLRMNSVRDDEKSAIIYAATVYETLLADRSRIEPVTSITIPATENWKP